MTPKFLVKSKIINIWVQTIAILVAGIWGVYVFFYQEYYLPTTKVGAISPNISLKNLTISQKFKSLEIEFTLENKSDIELHIIDGVFSLYGCIIDSINRSSKDFKSKYENSEKLHPSSIGLEKFAKSSEQNPDHLAMGRAFEEVRFVPNGKLSFTKILHLPINHEYDELYIDFLYLTAKKEYKKALLKYVFNEKQYKTFFIKNGDTIRYKDSLFKKDVDIYGIRIVETGKRIPVNNFSH